MFEVDEKLLTREDCILFTNEVIRESQISLNKLEKNNKDGIINEVINNQKRIIEKLEQNVKKMRAFA